MRSFQAVVVAASATMMIITACGDTAVDAGASASSAIAVTATMATTDPLIEWCGAVEPDFCLWGMQTTFDDPPRRACLLEAMTKDEFINSACNRSEAPPVTTIPSATGSDTPEPTDAAITALIDTAEVEWRRVLAAAHPDHAFPTALLLDRPASVEDAAALARAHGHPAVGAWMAIPACIDGYAAIDMGESPTSVRFAYLDAEAEAADRLAAAEAGPPLTGRFIFDAMLASIRLAGAALDAPGVTVEAVLIDAAVTEFPALEADETVRRVRLLYGSPEWGLAPADLSAADPAC